MSLKIDPIDPEFKALLPPLTTDELAKLEANLVADGCREPLMIWNGVLVDGHNRFDICTRLNIPYRINYLDKPDRDSVMLWMLTNQGGRRNLADIDRIAIAAKREAIIARQAKENQRLSAKTEGLVTSPNPPAKIDTRAESAKAAGVGEQKYAEGKVILAAVESGTVEPEVINKIRTGQTTVHAVAKEIKAARHPEPEPRKRITYRPALGMEIAQKAIATMGRITPDDKEFESAYQAMLDHCNDRLTRKQK